MTIKQRQAIERHIAELFIDSAIAAGYAINVDNGGDDYELADASTCKTDILKAMFATDDERLYIFEKGKRERFGWALFVYGNDGYDVIADYTTNLETLMTAVNEYTDKH